LYRNAPAEAALFSGAGGAEAAVDCVEARTLSGHPPFGTRSNRGSFTSLLEREGPFSLTAEPPCPPLVAFAASRCQQRPTAFQPLSGLAPGLARRCLGEAGLVAVTFWVRL